MSSSKGNPVIRAGPVGVINTVNLNWTTSSPKIFNLCKCLKRDIKYRK